MSCILVSCYESFPKFNHTLDAFIIQFIIDISDEALFKIHEKRLRKILDAAVLNMADVIILGAFDCGAFGNPPKVVASVANKVLKDYRFAFKSIEFAIYCSKEKTDNFDIFNKILIT